MTTTPTPSGPDLADPLSLCHGESWPNRLALAPLTNHQSNADGTVGNDELRWLRLRGEGGFGMVMTCAAHVAPAGQAFPGQLGICDDRQVPGLTELAEAVQRGGARAIVQLHHAGRRAKPAVSGHPAVAPWADQSSGVRALTTHEVYACIDDFASAAVRAEAAGFQGVEVHGAHGYLIGQFLDGRRNRRDDQFGGALENRARFLDEVLNKIREATSDTFQVGVRLTPERDGILLSEAVWLAERVIKSGTIDFLDMSMWDVFKMPYEPEHQNRPLLDYFTEIPRGHVRLGVAGNIATAEQVQACLDKGADFVLIGTGAIVHHDFARRALKDRRFVATSIPVTKEHLRGEGVGEPFLDYLATAWDDFVS